MEYGGPGGTRGIFGAGSGFEIPRGSYLGGFELACYGLSSYPPGEIKDDIYVMSAGGSNLRRLTYDNSRHDNRPSWSPDGKKIAFESDRHRPWGAPEYWRDIYAMNPDGSEQIRLTYQ